MRRRDRPLPRSPDAGTSALAPGASAKPIRLSSCAAYPAWRHNARREPEPRGRARPIPYKPKGPPPTASRKPTLEDAALEEGLVGGTDRVTVEALCGDPLTQRRSRVSSMPTTNGSPS